ncbi:OmpH family outer membrane protein [Geotoga petraea]|jgi:outer membrane protein|uniref:OmpH family outer membrane protein n=1 Tax=Geotoga petraea TaxID=28234 RepID=A0A1G6M8W8_9BACT|nr:OmpH family outer membrane protein [Geotoga petraea]MDK2946296.1 outer membrane protein [Geotoga sp.]TGG87472.1 OmpH family outer membrane protein [Geotoga petraea]SDC51900.1 periplasmic chaperone for outer membrane proteins Skp [Geotoga petraea]
MKKIRVLLLMTLVLSFSLLSFSAANTADGLKIGYVNLRSVTEEYYKWGDMQVNYQEDVKFYQNKISEMQTEFQGMQESGATEQQLQQKYQELQYRTQQYQQALQEDYTKKSDAIIQEVRELIGEFAKENSFDIVLFEQSVIFVSEKIDITERVKEYIANIEPKESTKE